MARRDYAGAESLLVAARDAARLQWGEGSLREQYFDADLVRLYEAWSKPALAQQSRRYLGPSQPTTPSPSHASSATTDSARGF